MGSELGEGGLSWGEEVQGSLFSVDSSFIEIRNGVSKLKKNFYRVDNPATDHRLRFDAKMILMIQGR